MELNLHANATTTPKVRAYIQRSKKSVAELAAELGVSETTIRRWRGRTTVSDRSHTAEDADDQPLGHRRGAGLRAANPCNCRWTTSSR